MSDSRTNPAATIDSKTEMVGLPNQQLGNIKGALPSGTSQMGAVNPNPMKGTEFPEAGRQDAPSGERFDNSAKTYNEKKAEIDRIYRSGGGDPVAKY